MCLWRAYRSPRWQALYGWSPRPGAGDYWASTNLLLIALYWTQHPVFFWNCWLLFITRVRNYVNKLEQPIILNAAQKLSRYVYSAILFFQLFIFWSCIWKNTTQCHLKRLHTSTTKGNHPLYFIIWFITWLNMQKMQIWTFNNEAVQNANTVLVHLLAHITLDSILPDPLMSPLFLQINTWPFFENSPRN